MSRTVDASFVDLHRSTGEPATVERVFGTAQRLREGAEPEPVVEGMQLEVGDTVALTAGSEVQAGRFVFRGGNKGRAHGLVAAGAFRSSPTRADVPQLLEQLAQIEREGGPDPVAAQQSPLVSPHERAAASEFARSNVSVSAARLLSAAAARSLRAVPLFTSDESVFVAFDAIDATKLRAVMEHLERPVNAHLVPAEVIDELLMAVHGPVSWS